MLQRGLSLTSLVSSMLAMGWFEILLSEYKAAQEKTREEDRFAREKEAEERKEPREKNMTEDDEEVTHLTGTSTKIGIMTGNGIATEEEIVALTGMAEEAVISEGGQEMGETEAGRDVIEAGHTLLLDMVPRGPGVQFGSIRGL
ncbi:hypothetical protein RND71_018704 [Anisodus tanguticus]|uniref:Uncharacterized protein n=1 Tax=Anisodus tanguticus TaxID=243964 RepID=A0AAE1S4M7_9SOLA|nr:hypothetical protein RND71_018704 [Anisodus tanguticus]